jgi:hypothetical protein
MRLPGVDGVRPAFASTSSNQRPALAGLTPRVITSEKCGARSGAQHHRQQMPATYQIAMKGAAS